MYTSFYKSHGLLGGSTVVSSAEDDAGGYTVCRPCNANTIDLVSELVLHKNG